MEGYKRISASGRETEREAIEDCQSHLARGRACKIQKTQSGKFLAFARCVRLPRVPIFEDGRVVGSKPGAKVFSDPHPDGPRIRFAYARDQF